MPSTDYILWCDLETTGNKKPGDTQILEVGLILTDQNLKPLAADSWLINPPGIDIDQWDIDVIEMHARSGLIRDLRNVQNFYEIVESDILRWLDLNTNNEKQHIPFAGSGIGHFDRKYIDYFMPTFSKRLTYWPLDIGTNRRMFEFLTGEPWPCRNLLELKTHRALEDTWAALFEAYAWANYLRNALGLDPLPPMELTGVSDDPV